MPWLPESTPKTVRAYTKRKYDEEGNNLYQTERWARFSKRFKETHPLCVGCMCYGKVRLADYTDHVFPWKGRVERFWNNVFQPLCSKCHGFKRGNELRDKYYYYIADACYIFNDNDYVNWLELKNKTIDKQWLENKRKIF